MITKLLKSSSMVAALSFTVTAQSAVLVDSNIYQQADDSLGATSITISEAAITGSGFSAAGDDKLVLVLSTKGNGNGGTDATTNSNSGGSATSITYGTQTVLTAIQANSDRVNQGIFYLDNVSADGDLVITLSGQTGSYQLELFALNNTLEGFGDAGRVVRETTAPTLTSTTNGAFIIYEAGRNSQNLSIDEDSTFGATSDFTSIHYSLRGDSVTDWNYDDPAGSFAPVFNGAQGIGGQIIGTVFESASIPEPSAALLGILGSMLLFRRKR